MNGENDNEIRKKSTPDNAVLGENIRQKRLKKNISQEYLAEKLDISRQSISKWENGLSEPSRKNLAQLAVILDCDLSELMPQMHGSSEKDDLIVVGIAVLKNDTDRLKSFFQEMPSDIYDYYKVSFVIAWNGTKEEQAINKANLEQYVRRAVLPVAFGREEIGANQIYVVNQKNDGGRFGSFFRSLAEQYGENSIAVWLSGGANYDEEISLVKKAGGMTICCEPESRLSNRDLWNAAGGNAFQHVLDPVVMGYWIASFVRKRFLDVDNHNHVVLLEKNYNHIIKILKKESELPLEDFREEFIITAILERIKSNNSFLSADFYIRYLEESEEEQKQLLNTILKYSRRNAPRIGELLELQQVLRHMDTKNAEIRIWVADCGSGLEVYTIAMLLSEFTNENIRYESVKIFATDMDENTITTAIKGCYKESELTEIPERWKEKYFNKSENGYLIRQKIRNMVIFSVHNIMTNSPFARLDLVVCRNAMNVFRIRSRRDMIKRFSYALRQNGILMLGKGQDIREVFRYFERIDGYESIYTKERGVSFLKPVYIEKENLTVGKVIEQLLAAALPTCIITNEQYEILYMGKDGGRYIELKSGVFSKNLFDNIDKEIGININAAIRKLKIAQDESRESVRLKRHSCCLTVHVIKKQISESNYYLIWFDETTTADDDNIKSSDHERAEMERELAITQESLMHALEELENIKEKYEVNNEKLQSTNEELVVINDELSIANGELEATNRKLTRVNRELMEANNRLTKANKLKSVHEEDNTAL